MVGAARVNEPLIQVRNFLGSRILDVGWLWMSRMGSNMWYMSSAIVAKVTRGIGLDDGIMKAVWACSCEELDCFGLEVVVVEDSLVSVWDAVSSNSWFDWDSWVLSVLVACCSQSFFFSSKLHFLHSLNL